MKPSTPSTAVAVGVTTVALLVSSCAMFSGGSTAGDAERDSPPPWKKKPTKGLSTSEVEKHGATYISRPYGEVFEACQDALRALGYSIAVAKRKRGLLISGRLKVGRETATLGVLLPGGVTGATQHSVSYSRQYTLHLKLVSPNRVWVAAVPAIYAGSHEISGSVRWKLTGTFGERSRWKQLFRKVRQLLPNRDSATQPRPRLRPRPRTITPPAD